MMRDQPAAIRVLIAEKKQMSDDVKEKVAAALDAFAKEFTA